ncbi:hypothetical protein NE237_017199 [Protea cynaroides]|uniref:DUF4057 domain-containing protein n=1 Tax=Protea cynaroides TaxID=273540 RepID=A0A9Q0QMK4_9MAGN|nr:hypothetical protein NE237_017199 [Protea cynaroides]
MERATPVRKPHTSTADLLTWSENPQEYTSVTDSATSASRSGIRNNQPSSKISKVVFGGQVTDEEAESLNKRKICSGSKLKEITGNSIFAADGENGASDSGSANPTPSNRTGLRIYQQAVSGISQISFGSEESVSPKKPISLPEVAKQRELSGTLENESDAKMKKQPSDAKYKELSGRSRTGSGATKILMDNPAGGQSTTVMFSEETVTKTAKKINNQKFQELSGKDIFRGNAPPGSAEKPLSTAKLREMSGSDIFSDGKAASREYLGGVRKPPVARCWLALGWYELRAGESGLLWQSC